MKEPPDEQQLEQALRRTLRPVDPGEAFAAAVLQRLQRPGAPQVAALRRRGLARAPLALAASLLAALAIFHWHQQALAHERAVAARAELLQALQVASASIGTARDALSPLQDALH